jgi:DNA-binding transcriptional LysR family regulator
MAITVTQLTAFLAVVRSGSVTAAADELAVSQPTVSSALASLSRELGCELFQRMGRGIEPTAAGNAFTDYASDVIGLLGDGRRAACEAADRAARELRVVAVTTAAETFLPGVLAHFGEANPEVRVLLAVAPSAEVIAAVSEHQADVGVVARAPHDRRLSAVALAPNTIVCITGVEDEHAGARALPTAALADRIWLLREPGSGTRVAVEQFLAERGIAPATLTLGSNAAIKQAARAGLGVALISRAVVTEELEQGVLSEVLLRDGPPARPWYLLGSNVGPQRPPVQAFVAFARGSAVR